MTVENTEVVDEGIITPEKPLTLKERCDGGDSSACEQLRSEDTQEEIKVEEETVAPLSDEEIMALPDVEEISTEETVAPLSDEEIMALPDAEEPSVSRKMAFGAADEPMIGGSIMRAVETGFEALTEGKSWEQSRADVEAERKAELYEEFPEFASGKYSTDGAVMAGRVGVAVIDPATFLLPWTKAAKVGKAMSTAAVGEKTSKTAKVTGAVVEKAPLFALGAGTSAADYSMYAYMREGEVDTTGLFYVSAAGGTLTVAVEPFAKYLIKKYQTKYGKGATAEKLGKATSAEEVQKLLGEKAYKNLTAKQRKAIDEVFELPHLRDLNGMLSRTSNMTEILANKASRRKEITKQLRAKKITKVQAKKARDKVESEYHTSINTLVDSRTKAIQDIVDTLHKNKSLTAKTFEYATRPIIGSLLGGGAGLLAGGDDDTVQMLMVAGLVTGAAQKYIQKHSLISDADKKSISFGLLKRQWALRAQAIKYHTSATQVTRLKSLGETTSKFADMMHHTFSPKGVRQMAVEERAHSATQFWSIILEKDVLKGTTVKQQQAAVRHLRGFSSKKDQTKEVLELSDRLNDYLKQFKKYHEDVGIKAKDELENYFPREYNFEMIDDVTSKLVLPINHPAYKTFNGKSFNEVIAQIMKRRDKISIAAARVKADNFITSVKSGDIETITRAVSANDFKLRKLPFIKHMEKHRELHGSITIKGKTVQIEELLNPWLGQDIRAVLGNMAKESSKAVEFTRTFGRRGEVYRTLIHDINKKYQTLINNAKSKGEVTKLERLRAKEHKRINGSIDAFFGRYGAKFDRDLNSKGAIVSLYNSMLMLEDVAIANLGDLVQPFQNSKGIRQTIKAWRETSWGSKGTSEREGIEASAIIGLLESDAIAVEARASAGMADIGAKTRKASDTFYKFTGLHKVTSFARRFAFNAGTRDLHTVAKQYQKMTTKMINQIEKQEGRKWFSISKKKQQDLLFNHPSAYNRQTLLERGQYFGVTEEELMAVAKHSTYEKAYQDKALTDIFHMAGFRAMERDAKIPTVGNRLLFTQSRNPAMRLLGQFTSWAQAKTAQTNSLIKRIEDTDGKLAAKMMGALVIYTGIRHIRDIIREGTLQPEEHTMPEVIARANDLSGNPGVWLGYMTNIIRSYSSERGGEFNPLTMFPTGSTAISAARGDWDRLIAFPKLRNLVHTLWDEGYVEPPKDLSYPTIEYPTIKYAEGGLVTTPVEREMRVLGFSQGGLKSASWNWGDPMGKSVSEGKTFGYTPTDEDYDDYLSGSTNLTVKGFDTIGKAATGVTGIGTALNASVKSDLGYSINPFSDTKVTDTYKGPGAIEAVEAGLTPGSKHFNQYVNQEAYDVPTEQMKANKGFKGYAYDYLGLNNVQDYDKDLDLTEDRRSRRRSRQAREAREVEAARVAAAKAEETKRQKAKMESNKSFKSSDSDSYSSGGNYSSWDSKSDYESSFSHDHNTDTATESDFNNDASDGPSGGGSSGGSSGGGSYIATATTQALGEEGLRVFEDWRDYMYQVIPDFKTAFGRYRVTAPKIVNAIDEKDNSKTIYKEIWDEHLKPIYELISTDKDSKQAIKKYKIMVKQLKDTYL